MPDLKDIYVDKSLDVKERIKNFIKDTKDPYSFSSNGVSVKIKMPDTGKSFEDAFFDAILKERE